MIEDLAIQGRFRLRIKAVYREHANLLVTYHIGWMPSNPILITAFAKIAMLI